MCTQTLNQRLQNHSEGQVTMEADGWMPKVLGHNEHHITLQDAIIQHIHIKTPPSSNKHTYKARNQTQFLLCLLTLSYAHIIDNRKDEVSSLVEQSLVTITNRASLSTISATNYITLHLD